jgi:HPt (histidine-containing phosphotransfer) domain-containing protein
MDNDVNSLDVRNLENFVGPDNIERPLRIYLNSLIATISKFETNLVFDKQWLKSCTHQIKSSAVQLNLVRLMNAAAQVEEELTNNTLCERTIDNLKVELTQARNRVEAFLVAKRLVK